MNQDIQKQLDAIRFGSREEVWEAAKGLGSFATEVASALMALLNQGQEPQVRAAAAYVLGMSRFASAREPLESVLSDAQEDAFVRGHAAEALGYIRIKDSVPALVNQLEEHDAGLKYWCIFALGQIGDVRAVPALNRLIGKVKEEFYQKHSLRSEALDAIAEITQRQE